MAEETPIKSNQTTEQSNYSVEQCGSLYKHIVDEEYIFYTEGKEKDFHRSETYGLEHHTYRLIGMLHDTRDFVLNIKTLTCLYGKTYLNERIAGVIIEGNGPKETNAFEAKLEQLKSMGFKVRGAVRNHKDECTETHKIMAITDSLDVFNKYCNIKGIQINITDEEKYKKTYKNEKVYIVHIGTERNYIFEDEDFMDPFYEWDMFDSYPQILLHPNAIVMLSNLKLTSKDNTVTQSLMEDRPLILVDCDLSSIREFQINRYRSLISTQNRFRAHKYLMKLIKNVTEPDDGIQIESLSDSLVKIPPPFRLKDGSYYNFISLGEYREDGQLLNTPYLPDKTILLVLNQYRGDRKIEDNLIQRLDGIEIGDRLESKQRK